MLRLPIQKHCSLCSKYKALPLTRRKCNFSRNKYTSSTELAIAYKPHDVECQQFDNNYFGPKTKSKDRPFTLILPPPNITGTLHLGHALTVSVQDALVKWHQMQGRNTVWVPGLDHAGIATQVVVEKKLWTERGVTKQELGRQNFEAEVWKWKNDKSSTIEDQLRRLNVSLDWDKQVFTMDQGLTQAVMEAFIRLFDQGLIYRADHLVNWSCALQSAISDIEVDHIEIDGATNVTVPGYEKPIKFGVLSRFAYKVEGSDDEVIVATTRPETIFGDMAVAVNPNDVRYSHLIGKNLVHHLRNDTIPVIADESVDPAFGTGAVKVTPAHDPTDFAIGKRNNLPLLSIINENGRLTDACGEFRNYKRFDAREIVLERLAEVGLYRGNDNHKMNVPICSRSKDVIEFLLKPQWFLKCSELADKAVKSVQEGQLTIEPEHFEKTWYQWLENTRDWCISRQLWWGHRIPAYSCHQKSSNGSKSVWVAAKTEAAAKFKASSVLQCKEQDLECVQDEDVLDTWFSSGILPFTVFGWPENTVDLAENHPLSLMETGHDILFFWVARMVMLGTQLTGKLPFDKILLHGIICDAQGRKMSKSLGNVIAPEDIINGSTLEQLRATLEGNFKSGILSADELEKATEGQRKMFPNGIPECGADALRFTLLSHNIKSHNINFDIFECNANRLFGNKIWQATKFTLLWIDKVSDLQASKSFEEKTLNVEDFSLTDRWILSRLSHTIGQIDIAFKRNEFHVATSALKDFLYFEFCDIYLEVIKTNFKNNPQDVAAKRHCETLLICLDHSLRALTPFMPSLAQHLHKYLPHLWSVGEDRSFPKPLNFSNKYLEQEMNEVMQIVGCIRRLMKIFNVTSKYFPEAYLSPANQETVKKFEQAIRDLSRLHKLHIIESNSVHTAKAGIVEDRVKDNKIYLVVPEELIKNLQLDMGKTKKKKEKLHKELQKLNEVVNAEWYQEKAGGEFRASQERKIRQVTEKLTRIDYIEGLIKSSL